MSSWILLDAESTVMLGKKIVSPSFTFTFSHLADAFILSKATYNWVLGYYMSFRMRMSFRILHDYA